MSSYSVTNLPRFAGRTEQPMLPGMSDFFTGPKVKPAGTDDSGMGEALDELGRVIKLLVQEDDPLIRSDKGNAAGVLLDLLRRGAQTLLDQNIADPLTMLYNRRFFDNTLRQVFKDTKASQEVKGDGQRPKSCALLMIDVDKFKLVNDDPVWGGHQTGDMALKAIAKQLTNSMRLEDGYVCRYGGEEFAVILPDCDPDKALTIGNRLLNAVPKITSMNREPQKVRPNSPLYRLAQDRDLSISVGVAVFDPSMQAEDDLIALADKAAEHAKLNGRNQLHLASIMSGHTLRYEKGEPRGVEYDLMAHGPSLIWNYQGEMHRHEVPASPVT